MTQVKLNQIQLDFYEPNWGIRPTTKIKRLGISRFRVKKSDRAYFG